LILSMEYLMDLIKPVVKKVWKKYRIEVFLIIISLLITIISLAVFFKNSIDANNAEKETDLTMIKNNQENLMRSPEQFVEIAGAVEKPDVYPIHSGMRLKDVIKMAGGLSSEADQQFFSRNYNLSRLVLDQEKIYVPSITDINAGFFTENTRTLDYNQPQFIQQSSPNLKDDASSSEMININTATLEQLDELPGVGQVTAEKIIRGRPYNSINELPTKKIVNQSVFDKIKDLIIP